MKSNPWRNSLPSAKPTTLFNLPTLTSWLKTRMLPKSDAMFPLDGDECGEYMTDFVCKKTDGDLMVRECISRKLLSRPQMAAMMDMSRTYWLRHGVTDWGLVVDAAEE